MSGGYVLDFSNRTFAEFVLDSTGKDVYGTKYNNFNTSGSKANRLRSFWAIEPNHVVGKLLSDLLEYQKSFSVYDHDEQLFQDCMRISQRLKQGGTVTEIEAISPNADGKDFTLVGSVPIY